MMNSPLLHLKPEEIIIKDYLRGPFGEPFTGSFSWALQQQGLEELFIPKPTGEYPSYSTSLGYLSLGND
jgi:hypothetical protein